MMISCLWLTNENGYSFLVSRMNHVRGTRLLSALIGYGWAPFFADVWVPSTFNWVGAKMDALSRKMA